MKPGLTIEPHAVDPQITEIKYTWKSEYTGKWITLTSNVLDWNPHAVYVTLRNFSEGILRRNKEDIEEKSATPKNP